MKTRYRKEAVAAAMIMLFWTSAHVVAHEPVSAPAPANTVAVSEDSGTAEKADDPAAEGSKADNGAGKMQSITISMKVPMFEPDFEYVPIAMVNGENVIMKDLTGAIAAMHEGMTEQKTETRKDYSEILDRIINIRLMVQEGENIGLDQLPTIKDRLNSYEKSTLREIIFLQRVKDVKADEKEIEKRYRDQIREWKIAPLRFAKKEDADRFSREFNKGKGFAELAEQAIKDGKAQGNKEAVFMNHQGIQPALTEALARIKNGSVTPVIPVESGFAVIKLDETRYVENPKVKEDISKGLLIEAKQRVLEAYKQSLIKKYVKIDTKLLNKIDFEAAKPGFKALLGDKRVLVEIQGEEPITVGDLGQSLKERFFHGINIPIKEKKLNILKAEQLDIMLQKRVFHKEALALGLDKGDEFLNRFRSYKDQLIFGVFIENIVRKEIKVTEDELKSYYNQHSGDKEYTFPPMVRMNGLAFTTLDAAQSALDKMKQGVDFKWLKTNADGQAPEDSPELLKFSENLIVSTTLPDNLRKILTGAKSGDHRLYSDEAGRYYAIHLMEIIPQRQKTFEEAREGVTNLVYGENLKKGIAEWATRLREAADIKVYVDLAEIKQQ